MFFYFPRSLQYMISLLVLSALCFVCISFYVFNYRHATSWNFGGMGMYTTIDYPGIRKIHIYSVNQDTKEKIPIDIQSIHSEFFKEFESYLSLPTEKNAQNIVRKVFPKHDKPIILEIWTLNYNSQDDTVRKSLIIQHEVQP